MSDNHSTHRIHPAILTNARELRREMTPQELTLWQHLRGKRLGGLKFRRQHPRHYFILDFYCPAQRLVIEIDGSQHSDPDRQRHDQARTDWLNAHGLRVLRFTNRQVETNLDGVLQMIAQACGILA